MTDKVKNYRVTVTNEFRVITSANRLVAGLSIDQSGDGISGPLTDEQLKELAADRYVVVYELSSDGSLTEKPLKAPKASVKVQGSKEDELAGLTRAELNKIAEERGVESPDKLPNIQAVKDAINAKDAEAAGEPAAPGEANTPADENSVAPAAPEED